MFILRLLLFSLEVETIQYYLLFYFREKKKSSKYTATAMLHLIKSRNVIRSSKLTVQRDFHIVNDILEKGIMRSPLSFSNMGVVVRNHETFSAPSLPNNNNRIPSYTILYHLPSRLMTWRRTIHRP